MKHMTVPEFIRKYPKQAREQGLIDDRKRSTVPSAPSKLEERFEMRWHGPALVKQHVFHPTRQWRLDFAHLASKVGIEIHGGVWRSGRHTRGSGFVKDRQKMNAAISLGWRVFELTDKDLNKPETFEMIEEAIRSASIFTKHSQENHA